MNLLKETHGTPSLYCKALPTHSLQLRCQATCLTQGGLLERKHEPVGRREGWRSGGQKPPQLSFKPDFASHPPTPRSKAEAFPPRRNWQCRAAFSLCSPRLDESSGKLSRERLLKVLKATLERWNTCRCCTASIPALVCMGTASLCYIILHVQRQEYSESCILISCWMPPPPLPEHCIHKQ